MGQHLHHVLEEFATQQPSPDSASFRTPQIHFAPAQPISAAPTIDIDEAYTKGYEDGMQSARREAQAEIDAAHLDCRQRLERAEALFSEKLADELGDKLCSQIERLQDSISDQLVTALLPLLHFALTEAAIREMVDGLRILTIDSEVIHVVLSGPQPLVESVWRRYCESASSTSKPLPDVTIVIDEAIELRVTVNDSVIQARLGEWISRLEKAVG